MTYQFSNALPLLSHYPSLAVKLVRDGQDAIDLNLEALVRSGDYLDELATRLDYISAELSPECEAWKIELQRIVTELQYVQRRYDFDKKT